MSSSERYTELMDAAQMQAERTNAEAVARVRAQAALEFDPDFDGQHCVHCSEDIPPGRLALGKIRCVKCQTAKERGLL